MMTTHRRRFGILLIGLLFVSTGTLMAAQSSGYQASRAGTDEVESAVSAMAALPGRLSAQEASTTLYGIDVVNDSLWTIDKTNGEGQVIGTTGTDDLVGLSCGQTSGHLYAVDAPSEENSRLFEADASNGSASLIGDTGFESVRGLARDPDSGILYAVTFLNELLTIDPETGTASVVGQPGTNFLDSLAYHVEESFLYAVNVEDDTLYQIDPETGTSEAVGEVGFENVSGLTYDAEANILYGAARASGQLITIDVETGEGTAVGSLPNTSFNGLANCVPEDVATPTSTPLPPPTICREAHEYLARADAHVRQDDPATNFGSSDNLLVAWQAEESLIRTFATFDTSDIPDDAVILDAELVMYQQSVDTEILEQFETGVHHVTEGWRENQITWERQPGFLETPFETAQHAIGQGWRTWTVQPLVQQLHRNEEPIVRLMVQTHEVSQFLRIQYASRELNEALTPRLCIDWAFPTPTPTPTSTPTPTPTPTPNPDLTLEQIETTQGIQDLAHDVDLTEGKETYVRVYPAVYRDGTAISQMNVQAVLHGFDNNTGNTLPNSPLSPINGAINIPASGWDRADTTTSFQFALPDSWTTSGQILLRAEINPSGTIPDADPNNNTIVRVVDFETEQRVCLVFIPVRTDNGTASWSRSTIVSMADRAISMIPARNLAILSRTGHPLEEGAWPGKSAFENDDANKIIYKLWWRGPGQSGSRPQWCRDRGLQTHYVGVVPDDSMGSTAGMAPVPGRTLWFELDTGTGQQYSGQSVNAPSGGSTLAHELGHNFGRPHSPCGNPSNVGPYPYPSCQLDTTGQDRHYGYDILTGAAIPPDQAGDLMSYADNTGIPRWPSDFTWEGMRPEIEGRSSRGALSTLQENEEIILAAAVIEDETEVTAVRWQRYRSDYLEEDILASLAPSAEGEFRLRLLDASGEELASYPFIVSPIGDGPDSIFIRVAAPYQPGTAEVQIVRGEDVLQSAEVSPAEPAVEVFRPNGGETIGESMTVEWEAADPDGNELLYDVSYSHDLGETWRALATEYGETSITVDTAGLPGSEERSLIRVVASDGFNTAVDESDEPFTLALKEPGATIRSPDPDASYGPDEPIILRGSGWDPEGFSPEGESLQWRIEGVGIVGTGEEVYLPDLELEQGCHEVTLTVTDSDGFTATATSEVCIETQPPSFSVYLPMTSNE